jgi:PAS domain S-box-containing protein
MAASLASSSLLPPLERLWEDQNRTPVQLASGVIVTAIALVDWWTKPYVSLGFLYLFPIMLAAGFLPRRAIAVSGLCCAILAELFSSLDPSFTRLALETLALAGCGLFVAELLRNRRMTLEAQNRFRALVETSPAAIVTMDEHGFIELANQAATQLLAPRNGKLPGTPIAAFLPELHRALRREDALQFRASMQCQGRRGDEESFTAAIWFSRYKEGPAHKLAAIVTDVAERAAVAPQTASSFEHAGFEHDGAALTGREINVLRLLVQGLANKEIAARLEVSESAVKNTLQQLFSKTSVRTRAQLIRIAFEHYRDDLTPDTTAGSKALPVRSVMAFETGSVMSA